MKKLLITILLFISPALYAAEKDASLDAFFADYIASYNVYFAAGDKGDIKAVVGHFNEPAMQIPPSGAPRVAMKNTDLEAGFNYFVKLLAGRGVKRLEYDKLQYVMLTKTNALVSGVAKALDEQGNLVERRSSVYSVFKGEHGWRIASIQSHPVESTPKIL